MGITLVGMTFQETQLVLGDVQVVPVRQSPNTRTCIGNLRSPCCTDALIFDFSTTCPVEWLFQFFELSRTSRSFDPKTIPIVAPRNRAGRHYCAPPRSGLPRMFAEPYPTLPYRTNYDLAESQESNSSRPRQA
jgi:hypothetical protein